MSKIIGIDPGTARRGADEAELAALRAAVRAGAVPVCLVLRRAGSGRRGAVATYPLTGSTAAA